MVLTKTQAKAEQARQALESGQPWKTVVKQYSIDEASKAQGGKLAAVAKGQQDKALEDAVFAASKGDLQGPVKTQFGWYVFEVEKITPASQQSLDQARDTIKNLLRSERQQKALDAFVKDFREQYKDETNCSDDYRVAECKNAPKDDIEHGREPVEPAEPAAGAAGAAGTGPPARAIAAALVRLDEITRRLRRECPWDREQDERSIVPHTVEEAYELADAAHSGDDAKLLDELGDVLFQVYFLALLLEERGQGDLAQVADHVREKLIRRHPHVFGRVEADTSDEVLRNWNQIKRDDERGGAIFGDIPDNLPSTLYAKKVLKRAESAGFRLPGGSGRLGRPRTDNNPEPQDPGERLLAAVREALDAGVDPELALRRAADRLKDEVDGA